MRFYFHPFAEEEFDETVEYYEGCQSGLGFEFAEEVYGAIARILDHPDAWSPCLVARVAAWSTASRTG